MGRERGFRPLLSTSSVRVVFFDKSATVVAGMESFNVMVASIEQRTRNPGMDKVHRSSA